MSKATTQDLTLVEAVAVLPRIGGNVYDNPMSIRNWATRGFRVPDDRMIKIGATRGPEGWRIRKEELDRFLRELEAAGVAIGRRPAADPKPTTATPRQVARAAGARSLATSRGLLRGRRPGR
jgi:hypothetical protein